ncbi:MAG: UDP-N-acetylglucosamine 2-epimerase, partial [Thermoguttaceae bacterium]|nr:UDP-N-acetylglucosamine 2-epimerase [Thermoguttaceae bacterium]
YSSISREYLLREGLPPERVIKTGSPMYEVLTYYRPQIDASDVLTRLGLKQYDYFVISSHREENVDNPVEFEKFVKVLNNLAEKYGKRIIFSTHPRTRKRIEATGAQLNPLVETLKPLGFHDYNALQINSFCVLSDSGTINEESSILNFPALNIRRAHERPEAMEEATTMMVGYDWERISTALDIVQTQKRGEERELRLVADYSMPNVSEKVARIILGYSDYVNRVVWRKML